MSISNYKRLLILDFHHCELIMCMGFFQSALRNSKWLDGLESITAWANEIIKAIISPSVDLVQSCTNRVFVADLHALDGIALLPSLLIE